MKKVNENKATKVNHVNNVNKIKKVDENKTAILSSMEIPTEDEVKTAINVIALSFKDSKVSQILTAISDNRFSHEVSKLINFVCGENTINLSDSDLRQKYLHRVRNFATYKDKDGKILKVKEIAKGLYKFEFVVSGNSLLRIFTKDIYKAIKDNVKPIIIDDINKVYEKNGKNFVLTNKAGVLVDKLVDEYQQAKTDKKTAKDIENAKEILSTHGIEILPSGVINFAKLSEYDRVEFCKNYLEKNGYIVTALQDNDNKNAVC